MKTFKIKKFNRHVTLIIALVLILVISGSYAAYCLYRHYWHTDYTPHNNEETTDFLSNPYCGWYDMFGYVLTDDNENIFDSQTAGYIKKSSDTRLVLLQINLKNFSNQALSENALRQIDRIFAMWADSSHDIIVRFLYDWDGNAIQTEPDDISTVKLHMQQTSEIVNSHKNYIFLMQGIFIGSYAEMHGSKYMDTENMTSLAVLLDNLIDDEIYLSVRTPQQLRTIFKTSDISNMNINSRRLRIGLFNDGMLGSRLDLGTYGADNSLFSDVNYDEKGSRTQEIAFQKKLCLIVPNGGEVVSDNIYNDIENAAKDLSDMHVSYLNSAYDPDVINKWKEQTYHSADEASVYDGLSGYEYITTHLGYRYVLLDSSFEYNTFEDYGQLSIFIKNEGFAPSYRNFNVTISAENFSADLTHDFPTSEWYPGETTKLTVSIPVSDLKAGDFTIYLKVTDAVTKETILFANSITPDELGYSLGVLKISK